MKRLVLFLLFFYFASFVIAEDSGVNYSSEDALLAIDRGEEILSEFIEIGLPYSAINDSILQAKNLYLQVRYADILRGSINSSVEERLNARNALQLVNWKDLSYLDVVLLINQTEIIREQTLILYDLLKLEEKKLSTGISNQTTNYFFMARDSFYEGRLNESENYLNKFVESSDFEKGNSFLFQSLTIQARNFFYRYWLQIIGVLFFVLFVVYIIYNRIRITLLKRDISRLVVERNNLTELMKKAQIERFKENKISALTYSVRIKSYQERLQRISSSLPVLQNRLKKLTKS